MKTLRQRIEAADIEGRVARIPFVTAGFPDVRRFWGILSDLDENGADIIEIGVPFSDPVADGPVVEEASRRALAQGVTLAWILDTLKKRPPCRAGLVLMGYYNPFLQYGLERLARDAAEAGIQGCIVPDLPLGEDDAMRAALKAYAIDLIPLVGLNTPDDRMREYARSASGYVYVVSVLGTTGVRRDLSEEATETVRRAKEIFDLPVALGFGISTPAQIRALPHRPHAAVFGSALLRHLDSGGTVEEFMAPWLDEEKEKSGNCGGER